MIIPETYSLIKSTEIKELSGTGTLLYHKKSGARIFTIKNSDPDRVFMIGFRTPPSDSTGVPHILEHSVLCGSRKFPVKDPFIQMEKTSLKTFLNAMTYPDKTIYPVASCNEKDFRNLMDVYMDAVLYPNIYREDKIFRQEGWHYELENENGPLIYNGVVYNEMKGALSSAEDILESGTQALLFPDTPYAHESGGIPKYIPDLTYEQFKDFHSRWYHPSNSYIYLYGDLDMTDQLEWLDREYLSDFDAIMVNSAIPMQKAFDAPAELTVPYSVPEDDNGENEAFLSKHWVVGPVTDPLKYAAMQILETVLLDMPGAILKQVLTDAGLGEEIYGGCAQSNLQMYFSVVAKNADESRKEEFLQLVDDTLAGIVKNGFDKKVLEAALNLFEFKQREADYGGIPNGLMAGIECMNSWLYDADPVMHLAYTETFAQLRAAIEGSYFEDLIETFFVNNAHQGVLTLTPVPGLTIKQDEETAEILQKKLESMSAAEKQELIEKTAELKAFQDEPATKEALATLPKLSLSDIDQKTQPLYNTVKQAGDLNVIHHEIATNGIEYISLMFRADGIAEDEISCMSLLRSLFVQMSTKRHDYRELASEIMFYTGGITGNVPSYGNIENPGEFGPYISIASRVLAGNREKALELMMEIITETDFSDRKRLREMVAEIRSRMLYSLVQSGHSTAMLRALSYGSAASSYTDKLSGIEFYKYINEIGEQIKTDEGADELARKLTALREKLFVRNGMVVSLTSPADDFEPFAAALEKAVQALPEGGNVSAEDPMRPAKAQWAFVPDKKNEAFGTASQVQYVAMSGNFMDKGYEYTGALRVLRKLLGDEYLWVNVRVKGGAYGCMCAFNMGGSSTLVSYRDPNVGKTLEVYRGIPEYLRNLEIDPDEMDGYVIGTSGQLDHPLPPSARGAQSMTAFMNRITEEMLQKERDEVLATDAAALRALAGHVEALLECEQICVVGGEAKIEEEKELFGTIEVLG